MLKMPPPWLLVVGKLVHAGKRKNACQLLESEQRQRNHRDLLSLIENKWL
jgi:hypothetical protein